MPCCRGNAATNAHKVQSLKAKQRQQRNQIADRVLLASAQGVRLCSKL